MPLKAALVKYRQGYSWLIQGFLVLVIFTHVSYACDDKVRLVRNLLRLVKQYINNLQSQTRNIHYWQRQLQTQDAETKAVFPFCLSSGLTQQRWLRESPKNVGPLTTLSKASRRMIEPTLNQALFPLVSS